MKNRILLVGDYNRDDFIYIAKELKDEIDFFFIEFLNLNQVKNKHALEVGTPIFWKDYKDAYDLIEKIKPFKVLFYFIETYNHVALNVACKVRNIPTYHLEHGMRLSPRYYVELNNLYPQKNGGRKSLNIYFKSLFELRNRLKNRSFFINTIKKSPTKKADFLKKYYEIRKKNNIHDTFRKIDSSLRTADSYISFSEGVFQTHKEMDHLCPNHSVNFIGVPGFDKIALDSIGLPVNKDNILFLDQPLMESRTLGWTEEIRNQFLKDLSQLSKDLNKTIYIKPHPLNNSDSYLSISSNKKIILIDEISRDLLEKVGIVLGFFSTLLLPFMAMQSIVVFLLNLDSENGGNTNLAIKYFETLGPVEVSQSFQDLKNKIRESDTYLEKQKKLKGEFTQKWLYKFDGQSTNRLKALLLNPNSNF